MVFNYGSRGGPSEKRKEIRKKESKSEKRNQIEKKRKQIAKKKESTKTEKAESLYAKEV